MFEECNRTELYQLCLRAGIRASPQTPKAEMIQLLAGEKETFSPNPLDPWRDAIMSLLLAHWDIISAQLDCPAKSGDPKACYQCVDAQVISCIVSQSNADQKLLELRKKK